jgi:hypothetical protein
MPHVLVRHRVEDFRRWKKAFDEAREFRRDWGEQEYRIFQLSHDTETVVGLFQWDDLNVAREFFESTELRRRMEEAGVQGEPEITYLQQVDAGSVFRG